MNNYTLLHQLLHCIALSSNFLKEVYFTFEKSLFLKKDLRTDNQHIFISGMARSGTTILLNALHETKNFASLTYDDMPFILSPNIWSFLAKNSSDLEKRERAHKDGIRIDNKSPEAFEEIFWKMFDNYDKKLICEFTNFINLVCLKYGKKRYLSKNNQNVKRIDMLLKNYPNSKIIIPFRDPMQQAISLLRQHNNFIYLHKESNFIRRYMQWVGHSEFGSDYDPLFTDDAKEHNTQSINHWLEQWFLCYRFLKNYQCEPNVKFLSYESLCNIPDVWDSLLKFLEVDAKSGFNFIEAKQRKVQQFDTILKSRCDDLHEELIKKS